MKQEEVITEFATIVNKVCAIYGEPMPGLKRLTPIKMKDCEKIFAVWFVNGVNHNLSISDFGHNHYEIHGKHHTGRINSVILRCNTVTQEMLETVVKLIGLSY